VAPFRIVILAALCRTVYSARGLRTSLADGRVPPNGAPAGLKVTAPPLLPGSTEPGTSAPLAKPQLFFLFMVYFKINNEDVWDRFFASAVRGVDYQALVHCKSEAGCKANIRSQRFQIIQPVATQYCQNLVKGMNALLKVALQLAMTGTSVDKFIFVSDSTLPVKPFRYVYDQLTADSSSDFCVFPRNEWAEVRETFLNSPMHSSTTHVAVKHHQWIVLSRAHALVSVKRELERQNLMTDFQLNMGFGNTGCLDEFWHFLVIFSSLNLTSAGGPMAIHLSGFNGSPLGTADREPQGRCDTFVHWVPRASGTSNNVTQIAQSLLMDPGTDMAPASETRPASIGRLSRAALVRLKSSPFLFARKVNDGCSFSGCESLVEAFDSLVFSSPPRPLAGTGAPWRGHGAWRDSRQALVNITSHDGSLRLIGSDETMQAKGYYCQDRISVIFSNGFRAKAALSLDGTQLHWHNGVAWGRVEGTRNASHFMG